MDAVTITVTLEWWQIAVILFAWVALGAFARGFAEALWADIRRKREQP